MAQESKDYVDDLLDMTDPPDAKNCQAEIPQYYTGRNILITGSSGFFGILLIERLLRCCPSLGKMYVLMRAKKGKSAEERFKEHFDCVVYDRLKKEQPDFITKVIMMEADFGEENLGLSPENRKSFLDTNIIFHMAATVRFNETIRNAVKINATGTKEILLFAREMPNLEAFVYVSTAFSHCVNKIIDEKYYVPPWEVNKLLTLIDILDDKILDKITPTLIGKWPNTYTFSKAIAEEIVRQYSVELPVCIVRPSIVTTTAKEPITGWINNMYGVTGVTVGSALGLVHTLHCIPENTAEIMPADYAIANIIVAAWDTAKRKDILENNAKSDVPETERAPIYNCVSSVQNPIIWATFMEYAEKYGVTIPSVHVMWYYMLTLNRYLFIHNIYVIFLHLIPAVIIDTFAFLTNQKRTLLKIYKKIKIFSDVMSPFTTNQMQFRNDAVMKLWDRLNPADREMFDFNIQNVCWEEYIKKMIYGLRIYFIKDPEDTMEQARLRYKKLKIAHYTLLTILPILLIWFIKNLINYIIYFFYKIL